MSCLRLVILIFIIFAIIVQPMKLKNDFQQRHLYHILCSKHITAQENNSALEM